MRCARCLLHNSIRVINSVLLFFGIGMIVYSLWLLKKWNAGLVDLPSPSSVPHPWFIATCSGIGIAVCLSTLCGQMVANCARSSTLCIYAVTLCCLLTVEVAIIVTIFFKIDLAEEFYKHIGEDYMKFRRFLYFNLMACRYVTLLVWVVQVMVAVLSIVLWAVGIEPRIHCEVTNTPDFRQSFLVPKQPESDEQSPSINYLAGAYNSNNRRRRSFFLLGESPPGSFLSYIKSLLVRLRLQRRDVLY